MLYLALIDATLLVLVLGIVAFAGHGSSLTITPRTTSALPKPGTSWDELHHAMQQDDAKKEAI